MFSSVARWVLHFHSHWLHLCEKRPAANWHWQRPWSHRGSPQRNVARGRTTRVWRTCVAAVVEAGPSPLLSKAGRRKMMRDVMDRVWYGQMRWRFLDIGSGRSCPRMR